MNLDFAWRFGLACLFLFAAFGWIYMVAEGVTKWKKPVVRIRMPRRYLVEPDRDPHFHPARIFRFSDAQLRKR